MCGITGWVSFGRDLTRERGALDAMTRTMRAGAPTPAAPGPAGTRRSATAGWP